MRLPLVDKTLKLDGSKVSIIEMDFVDKPITEGGEGVVVISTDKQYIGKIYKEHINRTPQHMLEILQAAPQPDADYAPNLAWPSHIILTSDGQNVRIGGVAMPNAGAKNWVEPAIWYMTLKTWSSLDPAKKGDYKGIVKVAYDIAKALRFLNLKGYGHADLSGRNILINPVEGRGVVIDLDGLVVPDYMEGAVIGTPGFIAPELVDGVLNKSLVKPSAISDRHAMAVVLYQLLLWHHPFWSGSRPPLHSDPELDNWLSTNSANALYVNHPNDTRNHAPPGSVIPVKVLGKDMVTLFERVFVDGIKNPAARPLPSEWEEALRKLLLDLVPCPNPSCYWKYFPSQHGIVVNCPICNTKTSAPRMMGKARVIAQSTPHFYPRSAGIGTVIHLTGDMHVTRREVFGKSVSKGSDHMLEFRQEHGIWRVRVLDSQAVLNLVDKRTGTRKRLDHKMPAHLISDHELVLLELGDLRCMVELEK
jgi:DNA-binding helix-hairpin-helix protein with protein kinase domain